MSNDPHAGLGGSYEMDEHGNRVLRERTGWTPEDAKTDAPTKPEPKPVVFDKAMKHAQKAID